MPPAIPRVTIAPAPLPTAPRPNLLGGLAFPLAATAHDSKWKAALAAMDAEWPRYRPGAQGLSPAAAYWLKELETAKGQPEQFKLNAVNRIVNGYRYESEGPRDEWRAPLDFFARRGDCEDFAIAKYASLKLLGVDERRMRLVVVKDLEKDAGHAVLAVDLPTGTFILDNQHAFPMPEAQLAARYQPLFALSREHRWLYGRAAAPAPAAPRVTSPAPPASSFSDR